MTFRLAIKTDLPILNQISVRSKSHWGYPQDWIENWKEDLKVTEKDLQEQTITVGELDNRLAGFCAIQEFPDRYEIMHTWLLPEFMGKGFGKRLLEVALNNAVIDPKPIIVVSDPNAEPFYTKQGFVTFDQVESYPPGRYLPVMRKNP